MTDRPTRLPPRRVTARPGDALRDEVAPKPTVLPATRDFMRKHAARLARAVVELEATLRAQEAQLASTGGDASTRADLLMIQVQALLHLAAAGLRRFPKDVALSMLTHALRVSSDEHGREAEKFCKKLEKMHARGENIDHLIPPGLVFDARGKLVPAKG